MKSKPVIPRVVAQRDVVDAIDHSLNDVWRVLHGERDIPSWLGEQDS